ncbi:hypothetical protein A8709_15285 [Paenibacillus pectinilyticus]|uniref:Uncharacterized protein n=1 Tax=Paenibacillus pectinilyticus TaxID=512399 RepID=A0A1C1A4F4_9BACL|nr:DUF6786 family protein [Paenibacillus pectinilyticus]OCT15439.1 hypothetical protein A8709_15285 [Paenibacillus pectinilyticus]
MTDLEALLSALHTRELNYKLLTTADDGCVVVMERGARILGVFAHKEARNALWTNPELQHITDEEWNAGGDRIWFSPEIQFHMPDTDGSYEVQRGMDPGSYQLNASTNETVRLEMTGEVQAFRANHAVTMHLSKKVSLIPDPLRISRSLLADYAYVGYEQLTALTRLDQGPELTVSLWSILQVPFEGVALIATHNNAAYADYVQDAFVDGVTVTPSGIVMKFEGEQRRKIAVKAAYASGRLGYFRAESPKHCTLIVRNFACNPSGYYPDVSLLDPTDTGYCAQCYKDDGSLGTFGELEYHSASVQLQADTIELRDQSQVWCYQGHPDVINQIAIQLLGHRFS